MTLLDAYALVAFLVGGPGAADVRAILREGDAAVTTANLAEALDVSQRVHGLPLARAAEVLEPLLEEALTPVLLDVALARRAAEIRTAHYHRSARPIPLADAVLIASARRSDRIATADPDVLAVAAAERVPCVAPPAQGVALDPSPHGARTSAPWRRQASAPRLSSARRRGGSSASPGSPRSASPPAG